MLLRVLCYSLSLIGFIVFAAPEKDADERLLTLSLEELLNVKVVTGSGIEESLIDAPAAMLVVSAEDIYRRGYNNLTEIFIDLPGFDVVHSGAFVNSTVYQRGYRTPSTTRTLFMVDGLIENHLWSQQAAISRQYPISMIERVEVLYGPVSVVYGPNAFLGVINVITKKGEALKSGESEQVARVELGSWQSQAYEFFVRGNSGDLSYDISARYFASDEEDLSSRWGFISNEWYGHTDVWGPILQLKKNGVHFGKYASPSEDWGVFAKGQYKTFRFGFMQWQVEEGYGSVFAADKGQTNADWRRDSQQYFIEHEWQASQKLKVNSFIHYRESRVWGDWAEATADWRDNMSQFSFISFTNWNSSNNAFEVKQDADYQYSRDFRYLLGWRFKRTDLTKAYDIPGYWQAYSSTVPSDAPGPHGFGAGIYHSTDSVYDFFSLPVKEVPGDNRIEFDDVGVYGALLYDLEPWSLNFGLRYDHNKMWESSFNPRVSAIYKFNQAQSAVKLVYGQAIQEPPARQLYGGWSGRQANPDLKPERAKNLELILMHQTSNWLHDISIYYAKYKNVIREDAVNDAERDIAGLEYRGRFEYPNFLPTRANISGNFFYTYTQVKTDRRYDHQLNTWLEDDITLGDIAPHKLNILLNLPLDNDWHINLKGNYYHRTPLYSRNPLTEQGIEIGSRIIFDTVLNYQKRDWQFSFKVLNLFDREVFAPGLGKADAGNDFDNRSLGFANSLLPQAGRSFWLSASYQFN